ncbi:MAG: hypothetical protein P4L84_04435 [Isosphaeraceae bacterium]|nr:hypothetical protein [Isosphaeraceae bacterium]
MRRRIITRRAQPTRVECLAEFVVACHTLPIHLVITLQIVAINGWNRLQVGSRGVHPVDMRRRA